MLTIKKLRADHVLDYAAEELKKYLRMMMPEGGEIDISLDPEAKDGFRLGLLEDFGLPNDVEDVVLDDVIHIDTDCEGGILAGSNPRSVLFSVYRFLRENGCRWLYPGVDGDYVPMKDIEPVKYHKAADHRIRGFCDEGSVSQTNMLECIEFYPKLEMNTFAIEWFIPMGYYNRYYAHPYNETNRIPEEADEAQVTQWRRQCEVEINKRGLVMPSIGHGWTCRAFGFPANNNTKNTYELGDYENADKSMLAMLNGKRDFFRNVPIYTQVCMSRQDVRDKITDEIVAYAEKHTNMTYLRISLADGSKNHCECPECSKMRPADWLWTMLNEADEKLTAKNLPTRLTVSAYMDTFFAPEKVRLKNPKRFMLGYAPISRDYQSSITEDSVIPEPTPYVRNKWKDPVTTEEAFALFREYHKIWDGTIFNFEYHFWRHQFLDPGGLSLAKRLYEDVRSMKVMGIHGIMEDGSQRSAFPNCFPTYIYAETLMNRDCDFDAVMEDYFSHIYGKDWKDAYLLLKQISDAFDFAYMEGVCSKDKRISTYYDPDRVPQLEKIHELAAKERALVKKHLKMPNRPQTVSWRLLLRHAEYCDRMADIMIAKAKGQNYKAIELAKEYEHEFGKYELEIERYYDHCLACRVLEHITRRPQGVIID
ncbi:MAG: DUF4838 domain-containing protein [Oscillospiraceae bacterium]|nr:DUF4838 domain-containing protein [Oscillospiraceae bacterium]